MSNRILVFYGSYRSDRMGIRLAQYVVERLRRRGDDTELIDAKAIDLPMLDRMYKEHPKGEAPEALERLAGKVRGADGFVFITGEYNWGVQFRAVERLAPAVDAGPPDPSGPTQACSALVRALLRLDCTGSLLPRSCPAGRSATRPTAPA